MPLKLILVYCILRITNIMLNFLNKWKFYQFQMQNLKTSQNLLLTLSLILYYCPDYGLPENKMTSYYDIGPLNILSLISPSFKIILMISFSLLIIMGCLNLAHRKITYITQIIELFVFPFQAYICWKSIFQYGLQYYQYFAYGINLTILYIFVLLKLFSMNILYDVPYQKGYLKIMIIPSLLIIVRVTVLTISFPMMSSLGVVIILLILEFICAFTKVIYIIYLNPEFDLICLTSTIWGMSSLLKYYCFMNGINSFGFNIIILITIFVSINPPHLLTQIWEMKIIRIFKNMEIDNDQLKHYCLIYLQLFLMTQIMDNRSCNQIFDEIKKKILIQGKSDAFFKKRSSNYSEKKMQLWELLKTCELDKYSKKNSDIFFCYFFQELLPKKINQLLFYFYKSRLYRQNLTLFQKIQLDRIFDILKLSGKFTTQHKILESQNYANKIKQEIEVFVKTEKNFLKFNKMEGYTIDQIKQYMINRSQFKKKIEMDLENLKMIACQSRESIFLEYLFQKHIEKQRSWAWQKFIFMDLNRYKKFDIPINRSENNLPICICSALHLPGKIRFANTMFKNLVFTKGILNNINDFLPKDWRGKHIGAMIQSMQKEGISDHSNQPTFLLTGNQKIIEVKLKVSFYLEYQEELFYLVEFEPLPPKNIRIVPEDAGMNLKTSSRKIDISADQINEVQLVNQNIFDKKYQIIKTQITKLKNGKFNEVVSEISKNNQGFEDRKDEQTDRKYRNFTKNKDKCLILQKSLICLVTVIILVNCSFSCGFAYLATSYDRLVEEDKNIYNFLISYFRDQALNDLYLPLYREMIRLGNDTDPYIYNESLWQLENQWKSKLLFQKTVPKILKFQKIIQLCFFSVYQRANRNFPPFYYTIERFQKTNQKRQYELSLPNSATSYRSIGIRKSFYFLQYHNNLQKITAAITDYIKRKISESYNVLFYSISSIIVIFFILLIAYNIYENRSIKILHSMKKVSLDSLNEINLQNNYLEENIKKCTQTGEANIVNQEYQTDDSEKRMKKQNKRIKKEALKIEFWTQSKITFLLGVMILMLVFVAFMVLIFFTNMNYFSKYQDFFEGLVQFSKLVFFYSDALIQMDFNAAGIDINEWYTNTYDPILEKNADQILGKLMGDQVISEDILYNLQCGSRFDCSDIPFNDQMSLADALSKTKNKLRIYVKQMNQKSDTSFTNNKILYTDLLNQVDVLYKMYGEVIGFTIQLAEQQSNQQIISQLRWIYLPLAVLILFSLIVIVHVKLRGTIYQHQFFSLGSPAALYKSDDFQFYINSLHYRTNFAENYNPKN